MDKQDHVVLNFVDLYSSKLNVPYISAPSSLAEELDAALSATKEHVNLYLQAHFEAFDGCQLKVVLFYLYHVPKWTKMLLKIHDFFLIHDSCFHINNIL